MDTELKLPNETVPEGKAEKKTGRSWGRLIAWAALIVVLAVVGMKLLEVQKGGIAKGEPAPDFELTTFDGQTISTAGLRGKIIVVNFWASWCKPCEQEAADLEAAWQFYKPGGQVVFLGVDWTDTEKKALAYLDRFGITYPNGPDLGTRISQQYRTTGVPETFFIDADGKLQHFQSGPFQNLSQIKAIIDPMLASMP